MYSDFIKKLPFQRNTFTFLFPSPNLETPFSTHWGIISRYDQACHISGMAWVVELAYCEPYKHNNNWLIPHKSCKADMGY
jgi:hypothetical protein